MRIQASEKAVIAFLIGLFFTVFYVNAFIDRNFTIRACDRQNATRIVLAKSVEQASKSAATAEARAQYKINLDLLEQSSAEFSAEPGSVIVDCNDAIPAPFPFNLVVE